MKSFRPISIERDRPPAVLHYSYEPWRLEHERSERLRRLQWPAAILAAVAIILIASLAPPSHARTMAIGSSCLMLFMIWFARN